MKIAIVDRDIKFLQASFNIFRKIGTFEILCYNNIEKFNNVSNEYEFIILDVDGIQYSREHYEKSFIFLTDRKDKMQDAFGPNVYSFINKDDSFDKYKEIIEGAILKKCRHDKIMLKTDKGLMAFKLCEIVHLHYIDNRVIGMVCENKNFNIIGNTLKDIEVKLRNNFIYVDRGTIINIEKVASINKTQLFLQGVFQNFEISKRIRKGEGNKWRII